MIFLKLKHFHFVHVKMFCFDIVFQNSISNTNLSNWKVPENNQIQMNNLKKKLLRVHQNILVNAKWIFFQVLQWDGKLKKKKGVSLNLTLLQPRFFSLVTELKNPLFIQLYAVS